MGNFSGLAPESVADRYKGGVKIYLESEEDVAIIGSKWFFALKDRCSFESADEGNPDSSGGCRMVIKRVEQARVQGLDAYGIVDRDILLGDDTPKGLIWETNDAALEATEPFGEHIHVLRRWEIENYLLHPEALAHLIANKKLSPTRKPNEEVARALIAHEDDLITVTLLSTMTVTNGLGSPKAGFGSHRSGAKLRTEVKEVLRRHVAEFDEHHQRVEAFSEGEKDPVARWDKLSRMLDGKRVFHRLGHAINELKGVDMSAERGTLADIIKNLGLIDPEFESFFGRVRP